MGFLMMWFFSRCLVSAVLIVGDFDGFFLLMAVLMFLVGV